MTISKKDMFKANVIIKSPLFNLMGKIDSLFPFDGTCHACPFSNLLVGIYNKWNLWGYDE